MHANLSPYLSSRRGRCKISGDHGRTEQIVDIEGFQRLSSEILRKGLVYEETRESWVPSCVIQCEYECVDSVQARVTKFQSRADIPVFLLTSQVGGLGLTLTGADRVIIVDPAWNPSVDAQSVDRAYRIGQEKDVVVRTLMNTFVCSTAIRACMTGIGHSVRLPGILGSFLFLGVGDFG